MIGKQIIKSSTLYIYTDGSSFHKPRKGGMGIRYLYLDEQDNECNIDLDVDGYLGATNNQMELKAIIEALKHLPNQDIKISYTFIQVRTDSSYVADNYKKAIYSWPNQRWLNYQGKPIENVDLWKQLVKILKETPCKAEIIWVKGHAKDVHNKAVDKLAKKSAKSFLKRPLNTVKLRRKKSSKSTKIGSVEMKGQKLTIHIINDEYLKTQKLSKYRYEVMSKRSHYYQCLDIAYSELHHLKSGHSYVVTFNKNSNNPRILKLIKEINS